MNGYQHAIIGKRKFVVYISGKPFIVRLEPKFNACILEIGTLYPFTDLEGCKALELLSEGESIDNIAKKLNRSVEEVKKFLNDLEEIIRNVGVI
jgi:hypothetical protein